MIRIGGLLACFIVLLAASSSDACKYSVRDVGFVPMKGVDYELVLIVEPERDEAFRKKFEATARAALADSNVVFSMVDEKAGKTGTRGLWLFAPNGRNAPVIIPLTDGVVDWTELSKSISAIVDSPVRRDLANKLPGAFAMLVFVEGSDRVENRQSLDAVQQAANQVADVIERGRLEKGAKERPGVVAIPFAQRAAEKWLIWSLGVDDPNRATAAIVFGRFRRGAKLFAGDDLTTETLFSPLATLGFSCECDLDRSKIYGPALPHRWTNEDRKRTAAANGFEPDDPLVRAEVNNILKKPAVIEAGELALNYKDLLLGLKETPLEEGDAVGPNPPAKAEAPSPTAIPPATQSDDNDRPSHLRLTIVTVVVVLTLVFCWVEFRRRRQKIANFE